MNYLLIPTLLVALGLFGFGVRLARKAGGGPKYNLLVIAGVLMALPGIVFSAYYLRLFGEPVWRGFHQPNHPLPHHSIPRLVGRHGAAPCSAV